MVVSTAFEELTEVLKRLETSDTEIRHVSMHEHSPDTDEEISAALTVGIPILPGHAPPDASFEAEEFTVQDQRIDVDLTVTLPLRDDRPTSSLQRGEYEPTDSSEGSTAQAPAVPAYKDPDALTAVYDEYDTFPEMTDALGVDVTSETVRRYMVEYDIHDPTDNTPRAHSLTPSPTDGEPDRESDRDEESTQTPQSKSATGTSERDTHTSQPRAREARPNSETVATGNATPETTTTSSDTSTTAPETKSTATDTTTAIDTTTATGASDETDEGPHSASDEPETAVDELGRRSIAEMIAKSDTEQADDELIADGLGIPRDMTVAELATGVNQSNTIHEVARHLDVKQGDARRLLQKLNLIDVVVHRLAASQIKVSHEEIARRITTTS